MLVDILEKLVFLNFFGSYVCMSDQQVLKDYLNNINPDSVLTYLRFESQTGKTHAC
jgi:hypothetical protein